MLGSIEVAGDVVEVLGERDVDIVKEFIEASGAARQFYEVTESSRDERAVLTVRPIPCDTERPTPCEPCDTARPKPLYRRTAFWWGLLAGTMFGGVIATW